MFKKIISDSFIKYLNIITFISVGNTTGLDIEKLQNNHIIVLD